MWLTSLLACAQSASRRLSRGRKRCPKPPRLGIVPRLDILEDRTVPSTFTVHNRHDSGPGSLRQAVLNANAHPGGDRIQFTSQARGTITLTSGELAITDDLEIRGPAHSYQGVSGNDASRIFHIDPGVTASLSHLTITHGLDGFGGGGIWNEGGNLTLANVAMSENQTVSSGDARGGAILNTDAATLVVSNSRFTCNRAVAGSGGNAYGGAINNLGAGTTLTVTCTTFTGNKAYGGDGGVGGLNAFVDEGLGGAISNEFGAAVDIDDCAFIANWAIGGNGGVGGGGDVSEVGLGLGGAIYNSVGPLNVSGSTFTGNQARGGSDGTGGLTPFGNVVGFAGGGAIWNTDAGAATVDRSRFIANQARGGNNHHPGVDAFLSSGTGVGGAIGNAFGALLSLTHSTLLNNRAHGGNGNSGPVAGGGAGGGIGNIFGGTIEVARSIFAGNQAIGGNGNFGIFVSGDGAGGGFFTDQFSTAAFTHSILFANHALGGSGGHGNGGGVYVLPGGVVSAAHTLIFANFASTSDDDVFGIIT